MIAPTQCGRSWFEKTKKPDMFIITAFTRHFSRGGSKMHSPNGIMMQSSWILSYKSWHVFVKCFDFICKINYQIVIYDEIFEKFKRFFHNSLVPISYPLSIITYTYLVCMYNTFRRYKTTIIIFLPAIYTYICGRTRGVVNIVLQNIFVILQKIQSSEKKPGILWKCKSRLWFPYNFT